MLSIKHTALYAGSVALTALAASSPASALPPGCPKLPADKAPTAADLVFEGRAESLPRNQPDEAANDTRVHGAARVRFRVTRSFKGHADEELELRLSAKEAPCVRTGEYYLVYARTGEQPVPTHRSLGVVPSTQAASHFESLGMGIIPIDTAAPMPQHPPKHPAVPPGAAGCAGCALGKPRDVQPSSVTVVLLTALGVACAWQTRRKP